MIAATCWEFYKSYSLFDGTKLSVLVIGFLVAFFSAWAAVRVFVHFVSRHTLAPFGWYRRAVAGLFAVAAWFGWISV